MNEVKILRLTTGEDVIAKVGENDQGVSLNKAFVELPPNTPNTCLLYTSPSPRDRQKSRMPSSA